MTKLAKLVFAATAVVSCAAFAQQDIQANTPKSAYSQDSRGVIARNPYGLCWQTGYYTQADAVAGCDGQIVKAAPAVAQAPAVTKAPVPVPVVAQAPAREKMTLAADAFFDSGKSVLKPAGKVKLDELSSKLQGMKPEAIVVVGHADASGSAKSNQKLSESRAEAVKAYLVSKGIDSKLVKSQGKGDKQPVASNKTKEGRAKNRRVDIEVVGTSTK